MPDLKRIRTSLLWVIGLTVAAMGPSFVTLISVLFGFNQYRMLVIPLILQGSVIACWFLGITVIATCLIAMGIKRLASLRIIMMAILFLTVISAIVVMAAGIELTKTFTSPVTMTEQLGDAFAKILSNSNITPKGLRGHSGETIIGGVTQLATSIAVVQLIGVLPFPLNVMLFFMYYKFLTALIFCLIPLAFGLWAVFVVYNVRGETQEAHDSDKSDGNSEDVRLLAAHQYDHEPLVTVHRRLSKPELDRQPSLETLIQNPAIPATVYRGNTARY